MDVKTFFERAKTHARLYNAYGVACQAVQETGWFTSPLCVQYHNYGGIKCREFWLKMGRRCAPMISDEEINKVKVPVNSLFRVYDGVDDYLERLNDKFIEPGTNYGVVVQNRNCFWLHFAGLYYGGWATDSEYFGALCDHAVKLAPMAFGNDHYEKIRTAYAYATTKNLLQMWMVKEINRALAGEKRRKRR